METAEIKSKKEEGNQRFKIENGRSRDICSLCLVFFFCSFFCYLFKFFSPRDLSGCSSRIHAFVTIPYLNNIKVYSICVNITKTLQYKVDV
jgi:hypothetical protein